MALVLEVDLSWFLHRAYHVAKISIDDPERLTRIIPVRVLSMVVKDALYLNATHVVIAMDAARSFRYKIYPRYKEGRHEVTQEMLMGEDTVPTESKREVYDYLPRTLQLLKAAGFYLAIVDEMEADDIMASSGLHLSSLGHRVLLATHDKDLLSVVGGKLGVFYPESKKEQAQIIGEKDVLRLKGVTPAQMRDYLILMGDAADSIPGVPSIQAKTAVKILKEHGSIKGCLNSGTDMGKKLRKHLSVMHLAKKLVTLDTECWKPTLKEIAMGKLNEKQVKKLHGGKIPEQLQVLHAQQRMSTMKGLFR